MQHRNWVKETMSKKSTPRNFTANGSFSFSKSPSLSPAAGTDSAEMASETAPQ
jgi:hypothetical protein